MIDADAIRFGSDGLVPAIVRDAATGRVLTLAWMNRESMERTFESGETWFWSRSRSELWHKGATSGNVQSVRAIAADCDADALLVDVDPHGPACHRGSESCFGDGFEETGLGPLLALLRERNVERRQGSYSSTLFEAGIGTIARKVGEEAVEVVVAALTESRERTVEEIADLLFHLGVLMVDRGITAGDVAAELRKRRGVSGGEAR